MNEKSKIRRISKLMSYILRHKPEHIDAKLDEYGWLSIDELIEGVCRTGVAVDRELLDEVVSSNDKQRFIISEDGAKIRANQGHSIEVDLELKPVEPPEVLYHGTVSKFIESIRTKGLLKMNRQHVHLSEQRETAANVGGRRGKPMILTIQSKKMFKDNCEFYLSENGVWLTDWVDPKYINE